MEVAIVTADEGEAASVTVMGCGAAAKAADVEVWMLQLTVIAEVEVLIPAANNVLVEATSASRGRITLGLSILGCNRLISSSFSCLDGFLPRVTVFRSLRITSAFTI